MGVGDSASPGSPTPNTGHHMLTLHRVARLTGLALFVLWLLMFRPTALGGPASYVIVSGTSMEQTMHSGDLAVLKRQDKYTVGDVVTYAVPQGSPGAGKLVIHRITGGASNGFVTQGDNRDEADEWRPTGDDVFGQLWFSIPGVGVLLGKLRDPALIASLAGGLSVMSVLLRKPRERDEQTPVSAGVSNA